MQNLIQTSQHVQTLFQCIVSLTLCFSEIRTFHPFNSKGLLLSTLNIEIYKLNCDNLRIYNYISLLYYTSALSSFGDSHIDHLEDNIVTHIYRHINGFMAQITIPTPTEWTQKNTTWLLSLITFTTNTQLCVYFCFWFSWKCVWDCVCVYMICFIWFHSLSF